MMGVRKMPRKTITLTVVLLLAVCVWWLMQVDREVSRFEFTPDDSQILPIITNPEQAPDSWDINNFRAFFIEYRLQRDRVRSNELEILNNMLDNPNISAEGKRKAEEQMLNLVETMEKELLVENLLKAQGYRDAIFFWHHGMANVVVQSEKLSEREFLQIVEMVSSVTGVKMDEVTVVEHEGQ
jgi:stage III sporulation protein AH